MKKTLFSLLILFCFGCKKESIKNTIIGNWELRQSNNIASYPPFQSLPAGNGYTYLFNEVTFRQDTSGHYYDSGTYKIIKDTFSNTGEIRDRLILNQNYNGPFISFENGIMILTYPGIEVSYLKYNRIH